MSKRRPISSKKKKPKGEHEIQSPPETTKITEEPDEEMAEHPADYQIGFKFPKTKANKRKNPLQTNTSNSNQIHYREASIF